MTETFDYPGRLHGRVAVLRNAMFRLLFFATLG